MICSFHNIPGLTPQPACGPSPASVDNTIVPLLSCGQDISSHLRVKHIGSELSTEVELLLVRAGFLDVAAHSSIATRMFICPNHRYRLGTDWRPSRKLCAVPKVIRQGGLDCGPGVRCQVKGSERCKITIQHSASILQRTGVLVQLGLEVCRDCLLTLNALPPTHHQTMPFEVPVAMDTGSEEDQASAAASNDDSQPMDFSSYGHQSQSSGMSSEFQPSQEVRDRKRAALDNFLALCDHSPVKSTLSSNWKDSSRRSRQSYLRKLEQVMESAASVLAPDEPEQLQSAYFQSNQLAIIPEAKGEQGFQ